MTEKIAKAEDKMVTALDRHEVREDFKSKMSDDKNEAAHKNIILVLNANDDKVHKVIAALAHDLSELSRKLIK